MSTPTDWQLSLAVRAIERGGIIAYPSEAVFGLGCNPLDPVAVGRLLELKRRKLGKGLILIASSSAQLRPFIGPIDDPVWKKMESSWPGPNTWIVPAAAHCPHWITGARSTVAVRVSAHPVCRALCERWNGALVSTSANQSGQPPIRRLALLRKHFGNIVDYIVPGALGGQENPTQIRDALTGVTLRAG